MSIVLVFSGWHNRIAQTGELLNNHLFLIVLETAKSRSGHQQTQCLKNGHFLVHRQLSLLRPHMAEEEKELSGDSYENANPTQDGSAHMT